MLRSISRISPRLLVFGALVAAVLMLGSAVWELVESRNDLLRMLRDHALTLSETVENSSENVVLSTDRLEEEMAARLITAARAIAWMDSVRPMSEEQLRSFAQRNGIFRVNILERTGTMVLSNHPELRMGMPGTMGMNRGGAPEFLQPILNGTEDSIIIGIRSARNGSGERFAVAVRRTRIGGGAVIVNMEAARLQEFRRTIGIGRLIRDIGNDAGIEYAVLQDREGILSAAGAVDEMDALESDHVLTSVLERDTVVTREVPFRDRTVYEVVRRLSADKETIGVLRIGMSMESIRTADTRLRRRLAVMFVVFIIAGLLVAAFLAVSKDHRIVSGRFDRYQMMTSNVLQQMSDAVVSVDANGIVVVFNHQAERLFGTAASSVIGRMIAETTDEELAMLRMMFTEAPGHYERTTPSVQSGREPRTISAGVTEVRSQNGTIESKTVVLQDLTETRKIEQQLQRNEKLTAMGSLASGVAHEIRNPLNAIGMIAQRYDKEFTPQSDADEYRSMTRVLKGEIARVNAIVTQFLTYARPKPLELQPVPAQELMHDLDMLFRPQAAARSIALVTEVAPLTLTVDRALMTQALLNLLQNALHATPDGGTISLLVRQDNDHAVVEVADTGSGVPDPLKEKIFDLYFTTRHEGSGLGLAITQQIIVRHGGTITVRDAVPAGAIFALLLPLAQR